MSDAAQALGFAQILGLGGACLPGVHLPSTSEARGEGHEAGGGEVPEHHSISQASSATASKGSAVATMSRQSGVPSRRIAW